MITQLFLLISGLLLLIVGSNYLLKSAVDLSIKLNLSKVVIGLTVVSFATSAPELLISISSALKGSADIAISNVIGSNIANLGLVLGTALCFTKIKIPKSNMKFDWTFLMIISFLFFYFINDLSVNRFEGVLLFLALILFLVFIIKIRDDSDVEEIKITTSSNYKILILILFSSTLLYYGSELFVNSSIYFAEYFGVSERVIGLTLVAIGTSLPELVTTLVAIYKSELDISIGNIIGSNIFNILAVIGLTSIVTDLNILSERILSFDIYVMILFSLILVFFYLSDKKRFLNVYHGIIYLLLFVTYYIYII
jgi:cation:H+ antiporter|tara:strand:- start:197 stop:1126 length:930 start_codon:yes stop_codon:yes gene_type:complete